MKKKVIIIQRRLTHYRIPLFEALRNELEKRNIKLTLLVGEGTTEESYKGDAGDLDWAIQIGTRYMAGDRLCWQPFGRYVEDADLVIVTQENKLLYNHWFMLKRRDFKLAFWGHGANLQSNYPNGLRERFKQWAARRVDWWFAYSQLSADMVEKISFPHDQITVLNNSIDTRDLQSKRATITADEEAILRADLGMDHGPVGIFIGSLHTDKRLNFLFAAADRIRAYVPGFSLLIIGDGPLRDRISGMCDRRSWSSWVGPKHGREKALFLSIGNVILNPGLVGLGILDSFIMQIPMVTTNCFLHSPEIAYLENGRNGVITADNLVEYSNALVTVLKSPEMLTQLRAGCAASAERYSIEKMVARFIGGIEKVLG